ncbi:MAG: PqqD family protein [Ruminococcaceae bacterium]|nr:PqqD family protein [Oscillospiraceae bacterium]
MKIKDSFILSEIGGSYIVIPTGTETVDLNGMITLNETGNFMWNKLQNDITKDELIEDFLKEYDVEREVVSADIDEFVEKLKTIGAICE